MLGLNPADVLHGADTSPITAKAILQVVGRGETLHGELVYSRPDGSSLWTDVNITPVMDGGGPISHCIYMVRDVTARRNAARQMTGLMASVEASIDGVAVVDGFERFHIC
jgi:PAS domain S-box-containing protein